jgi:hypothetical protein
MLSPPPGRFPPFSRAHGEVNGPEEKTQHFQHFLITFPLDFDTLNYQVKIGMANETMTEPQKNESKTEPASKPLTTERPAREGKGRGQDRKREGVQGDHRKDGQRTQTRFHERRRTQSGRQKSVSTRYSRKRSLSKIIMLDRIRLGYNLHREKKLTFLSIR